MPETSTGLLRGARDCSNSDAWQRLVSLYEPLLHGWLRRQGVQHADAEELVAETLATVAHSLPNFQHNGHAGAFRSWLRGILVNRLRTFRRSQRVRSVCHANTDLLQHFAGVLADPDSDLVRQWDDDHDRYIAGKLLERIEPEFQAKTWLAFRRVALEGADHDLVAAELDLSLASVYAAKSHVLKRLRQEAAVFLD
jgi:RNA polymerase sigma-70 factor (ECF subfamily)